MVKYYPARQLDTVFAALSDETRRHMLWDLSRASCNVTGIASRYHISLPAISRHLKVLERSGLVERHKAGREYWFSLKVAGWKQAHAYLEQYRMFWHSQLDNLEFFLAKK